MRPKRKRGNLITAPLHSEPPLRCDYAPPYWFAPLPLRYSVINDRSATWRVSRLRFVPSLRFAPLFPIAFVIVFLLCGAKKGTEIKDRSLYVVSECAEYGFCVRFTKYPAFKYYNNVIINHAGITKSACILRLSSDCYHNNKRIRSSAFKNIYQQGGKITYPYNGKNAKCPCACNARRRGSFL